MDGDGAQHGINVLGGRPAWSCCLVLSCCNNSSRFVCECCWLMGSKLSIGQYVTITIVGLCSSCIWREGCHASGHDLDKGRVDVVDDAKGLLPVRDCCVVLCVSRVPLPSPNRVLVVVVVAAVPAALEEKTSW